MRQITINSFNSITIKSINRKEKNISLIIPKSFLVNGFSSLYYSYNDIDWFRCSGEQKFSYDGNNRIYFRYQSSFAKSFTPSESAYLDLEILPLDQIFVNNISFNIAGTYKNPNYEHSISYDKNSYTLSLSNISQKVYSKDISFSGYNYGSGISISSIQITNNNEILYQTSNSDNFSIPKTYSGNLGGKIVFILNFTLPSASGYSTFNGKMMTSKQVSFDVGSVLYRSSSLRKITILESEEVFKVSKTITY